MIAGNGDNVLPSLVKELWAYGYAEAAAILVLAVLPERHTERSAWPFIDLNCQSIADWFLIGGALEGPQTAEIWFSWAVLALNWKMLSRCAELAPAYISNHLEYLAAAGMTPTMPFDQLETSFDYGKMITPWNPFHLMWLALRLDNPDAAIAHAQRLCSAPALGEVRTGRFINRLLHWPLFGDIRKSMMNEISGARKHLRLTSIETSAQEQTKDSSAAGRARHASSVPAIPERR
jgi:hypothetical protein